MELPKDVTPNNLGMIGLRCECDVNGKIKYATIRCFSPKLYLDKDESWLKRFIEQDLLRKLNCPSLRLLSFEAKEIPDAPYSRRQNCAKQ